MKAWGSNTLGQLGDGTTSDSTTPVAVTMLAASVKSTAGGGAHSLARLINDTVQSWGSNNSGQLGDGTTNDSATPVAVTGLSDVDAVAGGGSHSTALLRDGTVRAWGSNSSGQLGDGTTNDSPTPVPVSSLSSVIAIACGGEHSLALLDDGGVSAWGSNLFGQLGDGTTNDSATPVSVTGVTNAIGIAAGHDHSLAVLADGTVQAWGAGGSGQLGDGSGNDSTTPVIPVITDVIAVAAGSGGNFSLAVQSDGTVQAWGDNSSGQLGDGTTTDSLSTVAVNGLASAVLAVAAGSSHSVALLSDNTVQAWGANASGQLGDGSTTDNTTPVSVSGLTAVIGLGAGDAHSLSV
ncbi:RCC1 domain-containing protein [Streptomyces hokutonensis]|uniref:RCC1 domain-containing protein n=1 Tax=Streptomyces hokutonensis TaxID=1306990 RepID=UPI0033F04966